MGEVDARNWLLVGALVSAITAVALYVAYQKHYQQIMKCYTDAPEMATINPCKKCIDKSQVVYNVSLEQSKLVCEESSTLVGFEWDPKASVFYESREDMNDPTEMEKCDKKLEGSGSVIACAKVPHRKRGYFISAIVMAAVTVVLLIAWLFLTKGSFT